MAFVAVFQLLNGEFLSDVNIFSILKTMSFYGIIAIGETMLLCGGDKPCATAIVRNENISERKLIASVIGKCAGVGFTVKSV